MTTETSRQALDRYNRAIVRGRHPSSFGHCMHVWSFVNESAQRLWRLQVGQRMGPVVDDLTRRSDAMAPPPLSVPPTRSSERSLMQAQMGMGGLAATFPARQGQREIHSRAATAAATTASGAGGGAGAGSVPRTRQRRPVSRGSAARSGTTSASGSVSASVHGSYGKGLIRPPSRSMEAMMNQIDAAISDTASSSGAPSRLVRLPSRQRSIGSRPVRTHTRPQISSTAACH